MDRLKKLIQEAIIKDNLSIKDCECGCNTCHLTENKSNYILGKNWPDGEYKGTIKGYDIYSNEVDSGFKTTTGLRNVGIISCLIKVKNGYALVYYKGGILFSNEKAKNEYLTSMEINNWDNFTQDPTYKKLTENKDKFPNEIKSTKYWEDILKNTNGISSGTYKTFKNIIDSIKKQNNMASDKQMEELKRLKNGDWKRGSKN